MEINHEKSDISAHGVLPPYLLNELEKRNPDNNSFSETQRQTEILSNQTGLIKPRAKDGIDGEIQVYDAKLRRVIPGDKARFEGEPPSGQAEIDNVYKYTTAVKDFYKNLFGRDSIDGLGMDFVSTVNFGVNFENALWAGTQMIYGHQGEQSPFKTFVLQDICGHEITHGITDNETKLEYFGQSGSLNESISDVFGELIQQYSKNQKADEADWLIGEGIWKDGINGKALRDMLHPGTAYDDPRLGKDPQPAHMKDFVKAWPDDDNGGVHYNSGIPNRAFALFAKAVGGYAWELPGHIWFAARKDAGKNPDFALFAARTIEQAEKQGSPDTVQKLRQAWSDVGVIPIPSK